VVNALSTLAGSANSPVSTATFTLTVATPTFFITSTGDLPNPYTGPAINVQAQTTTPSASLVFCIDTANPPTCIPTTAYTGAVPMPNSGFLRVQAQRAGFNPSPVASQQVTIQATCSIPTDAQTIFRESFGDGTQPCLATNSFANTCDNTFVQSGGGAIFTIVPSLPDTTAPACANSLQMLTPSGTWMATNVTQVPATQVMEATITLSIGPTIFPSGQSVDLVSFADTAADVNYRARIRLTFDGTNFRVLARGVTTSSGILVTPGLVTRLNILLHLEAGASLSRMTVNGVQDTAFSQNSVTFGSLVLGQTATTAVTMSVQIGSVQIRAL
jgi:hypothetical protein